MTIIINHIKNFWVEKIITLLVHKGVNAADLVEGADWEDKLKNEVPSFEEFMKTYEYDNNLNYADLNSGDISETRGMDLVVVQVVLTKLIFI